MSTETPTFTNFAGPGHDVFLCGPECRIDHTSKYLVHSDCNTPMEEFWCPACRLYPDMQSTEFHTSSPQAQPETRYPLTQDDDGVWWLRGRVHHVWIQKRPGYCDRGHYIAHVEAAPGAGIEFNIDGADLWPRYYMGFDRMVAEVRDWLAWREG